MDEHLERYLEICEGINDFDKIAEIIVAIKDGHRVIIIRHDDGSRTVHIDVGL